MLTAMTYKTFTSEGINGQNTTPNTSKIPKANDDIYLYAIIIYFEVYLILYKITFLIQMRGDYKFDSGIRYCHNASDEVTLPSFLSFSRCWFTLTEAAT